MEILNLYRLLKFFILFGERLEKDSRTVYVDADLMALIRVRDLWKKYPDRVLNTWNYGRKHDRRCFRSHSPDSNRMCMVSPFCYQKSL